MTRRRYHLLALFVVILVVFSPAVFAGFSKIDDFGIANYFRANHGWNLHSVFLSANNTALYYRPLWTLSFMADSNFLGLRPGLMHLENVLIHILNTMLVYFLTLRIIPANERSTSRLPLLAAFLFGLHPVNTEPVNFLSGRSDLLAGTFVFLSALLLLQFNETRANKLIVLSLVSFFFGILAKETALAFLPGAVLLIWSGRMVSVEARSNGVDRNSLSWLIAGGISVIVIFISLRHSALTSTSNRLGLTLMSISTEWMHSMMVVLRAFGFYMKKLIYPYPLNFAILDVDPFYEVLAVPLVALCLYIASRRTIKSALFTAGILLISPAFAIAFGQIAWTPYAERYLYLASAFIIIPFVIYVSARVKGDSTIYSRVVIFVILLTMSVSSFARSMVWQNDLSLCRDTVNKSPLAKQMRVVYAGLLADKGDYAGALRQIEEGRTIPSLEYDARFDVVEAFVYSKQGKLDEAIRTAEAAARGSNRKSIDDIRKLIVFLEQRRKGCRNPSELRKINGLILTRNLHLYELSRDPHALYKAGVVEETLGELDKALKYYQLANASLSNRDGDKKDVQERIAGLLRK